MTTYDDASREPSEVREPSLDELLGEVLGLIDEVVAARLAGGELARRRARIKAEADRDAATLAAGCDGARPAPRLAGMPAVVPASGDEWPEGLRVNMAVHRAFIGSAERDAQEIRGAARQAADRYQDAALKRAAETVAAARREAEQILAAARQEADRIAAAAAAEREQTLATARREAAFLLEGTSVAKPPQPIQSAGLGGATLVDHADALAALADIWMAQNLALGPVLLAGAGAVGSALAVLTVQHRTLAAALQNQFGDAAAVAGAGLPADILAAASYYRGSFARSTAIRSPEDLADGTDVDLVSHRWGPGDRADARAAVRRGLMTRGVMPTSLRGPHAPSWNLNDHYIDDGEGCLVCCDAVYFRRMILQVKRYRGWSSEAICAAPGGGAAARIFVVAYSSNLSAGRATTAHIRRPDISEVLDDLRRQWSADPDHLALGSR